MGGFGSYGFMGQAPTGYGGMGGFGAPPAGYGGMWAQAGGYGGIGAQAGGYGGIGAQSGGFVGMGAPSRGFGGYGRMGLEILGGMGGHDAMGGHGAMGGMGAPPGGFMAFLVDPSPSTNEAYGASTCNTIIQDSDEDGDGMDDVDKWWWWCESLICVWTMSLRWTMSFVVELCHLWFNYVI
jgi:hypothetical protein